VQAYYDWHNPGDRSVLAEWQKLQQSVLGTIWHESISAYECSAMENLLRRQSIKQASNFLQRFSLNNSCVHKRTSPAATATPNHNNKDKRTFAHSGTIVNDKGGNIFIISHVGNVVLLVG
jgi:hypothetical protein